MLRWFYASCIIFVVCVYTLTNTWPISPLIKAFYYALDQNEEWWRNWIGALSGWAGAAAAASTLYILFAQIKEQRKQTSFILGDSQPSIDAVQHLDDNQIVVVRITNWNRRFMIVSKIDAPPTGAGVRIGYNKVKIDGFEIPPDKWGNDIALDGWIDRSKAPPIIEMQLYRFGINDERRFIRLDWEGVNKVFATVKVIDGEHHHLKLSADINPVIS